MLLLVSRALWHHRNNQIDGADFVVAIGSGEDDRDGSALLVDEEVHLRSEFPPICWILAHFLASQRSHGVLGVHRLPPPADPTTLGGVVLGHPPHQLLEYARPSPPSGNARVRRLRRPRTNRDGEPSIGILSKAPTRWRQRPPSRRLWASRLWRFVS